MRVFLAGATGVIGSPLVPQLLQAGHEVTAMTRSVLRAAQLEAVGAVAAVVELEQRVTQVSGVVLRYGLLYGPGTSYGRRGSTAGDIIAGRVPLVDGATGMYSWLHVEDAASAAVAALERGAPGIYNVVDDEPAPQPEWLPVLAHALYAEPPAAPESRPPPEDPVMWQRGASNAKAKRELDWRPRYGTWREGFAASLA